MQAHSVVTDDDFDLAKLCGFDHLLPADSANVKPSSPPIELPSPTPDNARSTAEVSLSSYNLQLPAHPLKDSDDPRTNYFLSNSKLINQLIITNGLPFMQPPQ